MKAKIIYAWRRPAVGYSLQLVVNHETRQIKKGYCLAWHNDIVVSTKKSLEHIAEALIAAGYELIED